MKDLKLFIESGILESYVMGAVTLEETDLVEQMAASFIEVRAEIDSISEAIEFYAFSHAVAPDPIVKPFLLATIDFTERLKNGEQPSFPPELKEGSTISDFSQWLSKADMVLPQDFKDLHAKIIGYTPSSITAIVWIKELAPQEVHDNEYEKFLVVEGSCTISVGEAMHPLLPGDYFSIPLHENHRVIVTSSIPCKVILQRIAA
ncbi:MAG: cupin domain-containing protein [Rhizobacter sp.]|nr:cupin domain-containing protein [Ferruginibacter sp.]